MPQKKLELIQQLRKVKLAQIRDRKDKRQNQPNQQHSQQSVNLVPQAAGQRQSHQYATAELADVRSVSQASSGVNFSVYKRK